jgi:hypothetical protein
MFPAGQVAHLVPASPLNASLYFDMVKWIFGKVFGDPNVASTAVQKLIHGAARAKKKSDKAGRSTGKREHHTGMKHMASNKIRLCSQKDYYDDNPFVLILPIYDIKKAKEWNGEGYSAIFMIDAKKGHDIGTVARLTNFHGITQKTATPLELETARGLLEATLKGMAHSLTGMSKRTHRFLNGKHWSIIKELQTKVSLTGKVIVPNRRAASDDSSDQVRVAKITFWSHESGQGHPAPDPLLLSIKAAINWSSFHDQKLLAAGDPPEDVDSDDESYIAEKTYLDWRNHIQNEKQEEAILGMQIG